MFVAIETQLPVMLSRGNIKQLRCDWGIWMLKDTYSKKAIKSLLENYQALALGDRSLDSQPSNSGAKAYDGISSRRLIKIMLDDALKKISKDQYAAVYYRWLRPVGIDKALLLLQCSKDTYYNRSNKAVDATVLTSTSTTEGVTAGLVTAGEAVKTTATEMSKQSAVSSSQAALNSMLAMLPLLLLFGALTGGGGGGSSTTTDGPGINLGRSPDSYYKTPTALSLPSFDVGTLNVPHDMLAQIHKGEVIIPAPFADKARDFISGGNTGGDTYHMPISLVANGNSDRAMQDMLKKHGDTIGKVVQNQIRQFKYKK